jgi:hypothetical protein
MLNMSRRDVVIGAGLFAAGLNTVSLCRRRQPMPDPSKGFYKYKVGSVEVTALYDGIWKSPMIGIHQNANVEDTKTALAKAGMTTEFMPIPLTVVV